MAAFKSLSPEIYSLLNAEKGIYNTANEPAFIQQNYPATPNISIDYAILEKSPDVFTIPAEMGWSDLGTWVSLYEESQKDGSGNVVQTETTHLSNVSNCLVRSPKGKLVAIDGLDNYIVVDEGDVLLIFPKSKEQAIKNVNLEVEKKWTGKYS